MLRKELGMRPRTKDTDVLAFAIAVIRTIKASEKKDEGTPNWFFDVASSMGEEDDPILLNRPEDRKWK